MILINMKKIKTPLYGLLAFLMVLALTVGPSAVSAAGNPTIDYSLDTVSGTPLVTGSNLVLGLYENSGADTINTVVVRMNYPAAGLTLTNVAYDNSPFDGGGQGNEDSAGVGTISISRIFFQKPTGCTSGCTFGVTGKTLVATLYFTVTATSGTQTVSFDNANSHAYTPPNPQTDYTTVKTATITSQNGSYGFPASNPPAGGGSSSGSGGGGGSSSSSKSSASSKPAPASTTPSPTTYTSTSGALTISDIAASNLSDKTATISWTSSAEASSEVDYGLAADQLYFTDSDSTLTTHHSLVLTAANLKAGKTYYFIVKSADKSGNIVSSQPMTFKTAAGAASENSGNNMTTALAAVGAVALLAVGGAVVIRKMHHRAQSNKELSSHVATPPVTPTASINGNSVVTPDPKDPKNKPPDGTVVG
jgi:hypothetical protein